MSWVADTVAQFGRQAGIERLELNTHGLLQLQFSSGDTLCVETVQRAGADEVLIYVIRRVGHGAASALRGALAQAHHAQGGPLAIQVALRGSGADAGLIALARLPARAFTPQALAHTVDHLMRWHDSAQGR